MDTMVPVCENIGETVRESTKDELTDTRCVSEMGGVFEMIDV